MVCSRCGTFEGDPCSICRTLSRIDSLITLSKLAPHQEVPALQALRDCAGALADLVEARLVAEGSDHSGNGGKSEPLDERERTPEKKDKKPSKETDNKGRGEAIEKVKSKTKDKKDKKKRAHRSRSRSQDETGEGGTPERLSTRRPKKVKEELAEEEPGQEEGGPRNPGGRSSASGISRIPPAADELQDTVDAFVTSNPRSFELATLPDRGAVAPDTGVEDGSGRDTRRPREPDHPPPPSGGAPDERSALPRRPRPTPKKSKGRQHRERGYFYRGRGRR